MGRAWLFGDDGVVWPDGHPSLGFALGTRRMGSSLSSFVVRNMGFIRLEERAGAPHLRYSPVTVSPVALDGVLTWLDARCLTRLVILPTSADAPTRMLASRAQILAWLDDVRAMRPAVDALPPRRVQAVSAR